MPFVKDIQAVERSGALQLLQAARWESSLRLDGFIARLQAGVSADTVGLEIGQRLHEIGQQNGELERQLQYARFETETCQRSLELYRCDPLHERVNFLERQITAIEKEYQNQEQQKRSMEYRLNYLDRENEKLKALAQEQQVIIANQQLKLAQFDPLDY